MKKLLLMLMCCFSTAWCFANKVEAGRNYKYSQKNEINKTFDVRSNCELEMEGKYSDFIITTWDKPQIAFNVKVEVKCDNEQKLNRKFNSISVIFKQEGNEVKAETVIDETNDDKFSGSISIKYYVSVPEDVRMDLDTKYGEIVVNNVKKDFSAKVKYGNFSASNLLSDSDIDVEYGNINIDCAKNLDVDIRYGDCRINKVDFIEADVTYGGLTISEVYRGILDSSYSNIKIEKATELKSENDYSDVKVANLLGKLNVENDYTDMIVGIGSKKPEVLIEGRYSDVKLIINDKSAFVYDVSVMFGDITCGKIMGSSMGKISGGRIVGRYGDGAAGNVKVELHYGDFRIE